MIGFKDTTDASGSPRASSEARGERRNFDTLAFGILLVQDLDRRRRHPDRRSSPSMRGWDVHCAVFEGTSERSCKLPRVLRPRQAPAVAGELFRFGPKLLCELGSSRQDESRAMIARAACGLSAFRAKLRSKFCKQRKGPFIPRLGFGQASKIAPRIPNWYQSNLHGAGRRRDFSNQRL